MKKVEAYTEFANVYDMFMDNVPYNEWGEYLEKMLKKYGVESGLVLELGCGTGNITQYLAGKGYDMIGIDSSGEMLSQAMAKKYESGLDILYLNQDMREFELYGTVRAVVSICDSMNYITEREDMKRVFKLVNNYLDIGGVFVFDMNTISKYKAMGDGVIAENRENGSFIWENYYDAQTGMNEYDLTLYIKDEEGKYDRYTETHLQKGYMVEEIKALIEEAGLEFVGAVEAFTGNEITDDSERMYVVAREKGKETEAESIHE